MIAVAKMLFIAIYNIFKKNETYNAELYRKSDLPSYTPEGFCGRAQKRIFPKETSFFCPTAAVRL